ncbi:hypothetical protein [Brevifollis gellanilyticus]|uniref:Uncharacterized protein n=1 Tax=Brevifollis gellanilyticus TaxID=748831 RepID=A0A512MGJ2_9BACT|nr:hypothetical protein [Brevifollis gellanilyticus]GEP45867.1 hypothetical protein BGE01nite_51580 [Brevifollis gellanilyticus]
MNKKHRAKPVIKAGDFDGNLRAFMAKYKAYPSLTRQLDHFVGPFNAEVINCIVLWKLSRFVDLPAPLLAELDGVRQLEVGQHAQAAELATDLQRVKGVQLAMASTFLRFANPEVFQIIDRHAYRAVYGTDLSKALKAHRTVGAKTQLYFTYLDALRQLCTEKHLPFRDADRILFEFDKQENPPLKETP